MHCLIVSSKAAALPIAPWGIIYINSPSGTDNIFCILVKLCWLEQFPLLALVPCPSPPVGTSRKMKGIFFILLHSWQDKEGSAPHFLFVIRKTCITSLVVKSKVILLKFERKNSSGFFGVFIIIIFFLIPITFLNLICSHMRGISTMCHWGTKTYTHTMINCLAWRTNSLQW